MCFLNVIFVSCVCAFVCVYCSVFLSRACVRACDCLFGCHVVFCLCLVHAHVVLSLHVGVAHVNWFWVVFVFFLCVCVAQSSSLEFLVHSLLTSPLPSPPAPSSMSQVSGFRSSPSSVLGAWRGPWVCPVPPLALLQRPAVAALTRCGRPLWETQLSRRCRLLLKITLIIRESLSQFF